MFLDKRQIFRVKLLGLQIHESHKQKTLFSPIYIYSTNNICILKMQVHNLLGLDSGQLIHRWLAFSEIPQEHGFSSPGG